MYLSCPNDFYSCQKKSIFNHMKPLLITRNQFLRQEIDSYDKKFILVTRNLFYSQETNSCRKKPIFITRNQFFSQKSFLVSSHPSIKVINSRQCVNPTKKFAWAYTILWKPGSQVPSFPVKMPPWLCDAFLLHKLYFFSF